MNEMHKWSSITIFHPYPVKGANTKAAITLRTVPDVIKLINTKLDTIYDATNCIGPYHECLLCRCNLSTHSDLAEGLAIAYLTNHCSVSIMPLLDDPCRLSTGKSLNPLRPRK